MSADRKAIEVPLVLGLEGDVVCWVDPATGDVSADRDGVIPLYGVRESDVSPCTCNGQWTCCWCTGCSGCSECEADG